GAFFLLPLREKVSPKATDEGCSREHQRLTPLEHPSSVSALSRRSTFSRKGRRKNSSSDHKPVSAVSGKVLAAWVGMV
ncbi:hypothetical protein LB577_24340, partial [Mesorhizobium sp. B283B1A]|uniref:hypothetical protein n=1 Tax=Mesorhizobium sp. B283B1A TaxID=2876665 RepID=UPI001CD05417